MRTALIVLAATLLPTSSLAEPRVGDTLACSSRDPNQPLAAVVGLVEPYGDRATAIHVSLYERIGGAWTMRAEHLPFDSRALLASCSRAADQPLPLGAHFEEGRLQWLKAAKDLYAGIFTVPVDQVVLLLPTPAALPAQDAHP